MIKLRIKGKEFKVPSEANEVSINTGVQVLELIANKEPSYIDKLTIISTLSGIEVAVLQEMTDETITQIYNRINFIKNDNQNLFVFNAFTLSGKAYGLIDFSKMTVLEYSDIEFYIAEADYPLQNLSKILSIIYRPIISKKQSWKNILINRLVKVIFKNVIPQIYKSYKIKEYKDVDNEELFGNKIDMALGLGVFQLLIQNRQKIAEEFYTLFNVEKTPEEDKDQYDPEEMHKKPGKSFEQVWGMFSCIKLMSSSIIEFDYWMSKPIREFFKHFTYRNQLILIENEKIRNNQI
jgi:hypothetical protein